MASSVDDFLRLGQPHDADRPGPWFPAAFAGECGTCFMEFEEGDTIRADGEGGWEAQDHGHDEIPHTAAPCVQVMEPVPAVPGAQNEPTDHRPEDETVNEDAQSESDQDEERTAVQEAESDGKVQCSLCPRRFVPTKSGRVRSHKALDAVTGRSLEDVCDGSGEPPREQSTPQQGMEARLAAGPQPGPNPHRAPLPTVRTQLDAGDLLAGVPLPVGTVVEVGGLNFTKIGETPFPSSPAGGAVLAIDTRAGIARVHDTPPWDEAQQVDPRDPWSTWRNRARAVETRAEAAVVYREAVTAGTTEALRTELAALMNEALEQPSQAAVEAASGTPLLGYGSGLDPDDDDLVEQLGPWVQAQEVRTRAEAAALYAEAKANEASPEQLAALVEAMNAALERTVPGPRAATVEAVPAAPKEQPPVTTVDTAAQDFLATAAAEQPEPARDRWGRYLLLHPRTGKPQAWTRTTTFAKSCADTFALSQWGARMTVVGLTMRGDLLALAHGKDVSKDKKALDRIVEDAKSAAGDKVAANKGTALHSFTELVDTGRGTVADVPEAQRADVCAYRAAMEDAGLEVVLAERITAVTGFDVAGTFDRVLRLTRDLPGIGRAGEYLIGDLKTGRDLSYGWGEIAVQLAVYAHGVNDSGVWDAVAGVWEQPHSLDDINVRMAVREDVGIVMHLPVGKAECTLYRVDLAEGWKASRLCAEVREWRKAKNLAAPVSVAETAVPMASVTAIAPAQPVVRQPSWEERFSAVQSKQQAAELYESARNDLEVRRAPDRLKSLTGLARQQLERLSEKAG
jgi:hypothetical protein